jgi:hypothetical protein
MLGLFLIAFTRRVTERSPFAMILFRPIVLGFLPNAPLQNVMPLLPFITGCRARAWRWSRTPTWACSVGISSFWRSRRSS